MFSPEKLRTEKFWSMAPETVLASLGATAGGLATEEVAQRLAALGKNLIAQKKRLPRLSLFIRQFKNPLIFVLLIAGFITALLSDFTETGFILAAAFANAWLGFYQENKAENALEHLKSLVTMRARVIRASGETELETTQLVPGDIIEVIAGNRVPADARILYANDFSVDQAILTGESLPVDKTTKPAPEGAPIADRDSMIFGGTTVVEGIARAVVTATGSLTELGKISEKVLLAPEEKTPLQKSIGKLAFWGSGGIAVATIAFFILSQMFSVMPLLEAFLTSVAILVAAVPEGLPIVMTVILAIGVQRLANRQGVVRRLAAAETLGSTTVILTDKTGTLTEAKMSLAEVTLFDGEIKAGGKESLLQTALLNTNVVIENPNDDPGAWRVIGKPLEVALVKAAAHNGVLYPTLTDGHETLHVLPFNSRNKFAATLYKVKKSGTFVMNLVGAPEILLSYCDVSESDRKAIVKSIEAMANSGQRVIGLAVKDVADITDFSFSDKRHFKKLRFLGTISFKDPLRPDVKTALAETALAGIRTLIVTGDHSGTAVAIANELGMAVKPNEVIEGATLDALKDVELYMRIKNLKVVARVSPEGKLRIVRAFQKHNEVVAMTGDGVNDAPSLREADIGIAMGSGSDIAKDVSDLVLLNDRFETIVEAVREGRRILENIRKAITYLSFSILDALLIIGGSLLLGLPVPLNPLQILWVNFFTDSFPGIALAFEEKSDSHLAHPNGLKRGLFTREMKALLFAGGIVNTLILFVLYLWMIDAGFNIELVKTFVFGAFGTYSLFVVLAVKSLKKNIFQYNIFSNAYLSLSVIGGLALMYISIYVPFFNTLFKTVPLPLPWALGVLAFGIGNVLLIEIVKFLLREKSKGPV